MPTDWTQAVTSPIYKKGNVYLAANMLIFNPQTRDPANPWVVWSLKLRFDKIIFGCFEQLHSGHRVSIIHWK